MKGSTTSTQELPRHHGKKRKSVERGPNITGKSSTTEINIQIKDYDEIGKALTTFHASSSLDFDAAGVETMETLKDNMESICKIFDVPFNCLEESHSM